MEKNLQQNFTIEIINIIDNEPRISHRVIAEQTNNLERSVSKLITDNITEFELFGKMRFEIASIKNSKNRVNEEKTYFLNEPQATLLLTFMRNNEIVKGFKIRLIKEFFKMRNLLTNSQPKKQSDLISVSTEEMEKEFKALEFAFKNFKISENEKRILTNKVFEKLNFPTLEIQPKRKTEPVFTLTQLLEDFQFDIFLKLHFS